MATADVVVIGGGIVGVSIAHHLLERDPTLRVMLLEKEPELGAGATAKATGGVRHQFSSETNVRLTLLSYRYFADAEAVLGRPVDFVPHGYLFVTAAPEIFGQLQKNVELQQRLGVRSRLVAPDAMRAFLPQLQADDLVGGSFCPDDGSADPNAMLQGFLARAKRRGLRVRIAEPVIAIHRERGSVNGVSTPADGYAAPVVVNAAGPFADRVGVLAGVDLPSRPYRRQVIVTEPPPDLPERFPLIVDLDSGWYVHRLGRSALLMGGTDKDLHPGLDATLDWEAFEPVFKAAGKRAPPLAGARILRAYAGVRDLTQDYHGILCEAPEARGFYVACGFSGHGFMHAPAIGLLMAELILDGRATSMEIGLLSLDRFGSGALATEASMF